MSEYFSLYYQGGDFVQWGTAHLVAIAAIAVLSLSLRRFPSSERFRRTWRYSLALVLLLNEIGWHLWHVYYGLWDVQTMLPLHLCNLLVFVSAYTLVSKNQVAYEFVYFLGISGGAQVLITPALGRFGFPHYLFFQIFVSHGGIILAALTLTVLEKMRPQSWKSLLRVAAWGNLYLLAILGINYLLGSNYLFAARKPPAVTLLDYLGPWPWYLFSMEAIALALLVLLYLPFALTDRGAEKSSLLAE